MKKFLSVLLVALMVLALFSCDKGDEITEAKPSDAAVKSKNYSFDLAEATYCFNRFYIEFCNENSKYLSYYGIDKSKSLKEQEYTSEMSWFDYFLDSTKSYLNEILLFCEKAKAEGYTLGEEEEKQVDEIIKLFHEEAEGNGYTIEEFCSTMYGDIVTIDTIKGFVEKEKLAFKYYNDLLATYEFTEEEQDKYLKENPDEFYYVDYVYYTFDEKNDRDAAANAKELAATADSEAFYSYIENYESTVIELGEDEEGGASESHYVLRDGDVGDWAFSAKVGDKYVDENAARGIYTTYMLTSAPQLQEYNVRNIRYICLTKGTYISNEKAKGQAEDIIKEWEDGGKTAELFAELAKEHSEDESTASNGGLCTDVDKTNSILSDEGVEWLFNEAEVGDLKLFKEETMYYIVYLESIGDVQWRVNANDIMSELQYLRDVEAMEADFNIEMVDGVLQQIDE